MSPTLPRAALLLPLLAACNLDFFDTTEKNCDPRNAFWPDADGDGVGDFGSVYIGCSAPDGYVAVPPDTDAPADTAPSPTADTGSDTDTDGA